MSVPRRPWQSREDVPARWARIRSVSRGASVAGLVLVLATAGSVAGIVTSNQQHGVAQAAAAVVLEPGSDPSGSGSSIGDGSASSVTLAQAGTSTIIPTPVLPIAITPKPTSQGQPGVVPVPLAPRAVAGPIPLLAWEAYHYAAASSGCNLPWYLLAGIGKIESDHGRFHGARYDVNGTVHPSIYGPPTAYGRAMGPMQFIPPTWASYAADGNGDGVSNPQNVFDATKAAAHYLCNAGGRDLSGIAAQRRAVFAYNHLDSYVADVLAFAAAYQNGRPEKTVPVVPITYPKPAPSTTSAAPTRTSAPTRTTTSATTTTSVSATTTKPSSTTPTTSATKTTGSPTPTGTCSTSASPTTTPTKTTSPTKTTGPTKTTVPTKTTGPTSTKPSSSSSATSGPSSSTSATSPTPTGPTTPTCPACPTPSGSSTSAPSPTCPSAPTATPTTRPAATRTS